MLKTRTLNRTVNRTLSFFMKKNLETFQKHLFLFRQTFPDFPRKVWNDATLVFGELAGRSHIEFFKSLQILWLQVIYPENSKAIAMVEAEEEPEVASSIGGSTTKLHTKVVFHLTKPCSCLLCNASSTEASPLSNRSDFDRWGGKRPWKAYKKITDRVTKETVRAPEGRLCLLCFNVYRMLGYDSKCGTVKEYNKKVLSGSQGNHGAFMSSLQQWIQGHNDNPDAVRLRDKASICHVDSVLETTDAMGSRLLAPKREFILVENWDEAKYGKLSEQVVLERDVFGTMKKECIANWVRMAIMI